MRAVVTDRVHGKELYMPMNSTESPVNRLTSSHTDSVTHTPAYKETSVQMRVLPEHRRKPTAADQSSLRPPDTSERRRGRAEMEASGLPHSRKPSRPESTDIKKRKQNNGSPDSFGAAAARCA